MINLTEIANKVVDLQHSYTVRWHEDKSYALPDIEPETLIVTQHKANFDLWHEEDKARDPKASNKEIARVKAAIDKLNQQRNDLITEIDIFLAETTFKSLTTDDLPWNSETVGSIIDRLSIASLKVYHMQEQVERKDSTEVHIESCKQKSYQLEVQRKDLATALQLLIDDILNGKKQNKLYRQFKMYNDPSLNPQIYLARNNNFS